jgi:hypothetical protein
VRTHIFHGANIPRFAGQALVEKCRLKEADYCLLPFFRQCVQDGMVCDNQSRKSSHVMFFAVPVIVAFPPWLLVFCVKLIRNLFPKPVYSEVSVTHLTNSENLK